MIRLFGKVFLGLLLIWYSTWSSACLPNHIFSQIQLNEMFHNAILNNVRKINSYFKFADCSLVCVVNSLNEANIHYTISGSIITYRTDQFGLSTMVLDDPKARTLSGYLTCNARGTWQYIKLPIQFGRSKVVMDFQSTDAEKTSRTIALINVSRSEFFNQMSVIKEQALGIERLKGYQVVNFKDGNKVFVIDSELSKGKLTYVFEQ